MVRQPGASDCKDRARASRTRRARAGTVALAALAAALLAGAAAATLAPAASTGGAGTTSETGHFAVGLRVLKLVDRSRTIVLDGRRQPRTLVTYVRYPAIGPAGASDLANAPPATASGPYPLVVFGHGFGVTPAIYASLLQSWARAGFVVAAPVFPLGNADTPGGAQESDVINQPGDMSFVITSMLALSGAPAGTSTFAGLVDPSRVAVAGHSDGAESALAVAYSRRYRDPRVRASVILSGAEMSGIGGYSYPSGSPPLLAVQGTADTFNEPQYTYTYFRHARRPKYLLRLIGAEHLPPYTVEQPQLSIVERVSIAFLRSYLTSRGPLSSIGRLPLAPAFASLASEP